MRNQALRIDPPKMNIRFLADDDSYTIRGNSADGYINQKVMKDDPECREKVEALLARLYQHQKAELALFKATAGIEMDSQYDQLLDVFNAEFESNEEE